MRKKKNGARRTERDISRAIEDIFSNHPTQIYTQRQIFRELKLNTHPLKMTALSILDEMIWDDFLVQTAEGAYRLNETTQIQTGTFRRKANGKNSFLPDSGGSVFFVAERNSMGALDGDKVQVAFLARREKHIKEAVVTQILKRVHETLVGKVNISKDHALLLPQEELMINDVIIPKNLLKGAKTGDKVVVKVTQWPDKEQHNIYGEVIDVLGKQGDNDTEMHAILAQYSLPYAYPEQVEREAEKINYNITQKDLEEREDFRNVFTCTIDPYDAKDFDDALSLQYLNNGQIEVGVHIADVSHYVKEGSIIDKEAYNRATSIYLVDRTIPMLPERLCNFICSLRPKEDKLAYSVIFEMDENANVKQWRLTHTIIRSDRRFTYEEVQEILQTNGVKDGTGQPAPSKPQQEYVGEYANELITLDALAKKLRQKRFENGSIKFEREELHFDIDDKGKPIRCYFKTSKDANKLIEEFMLLANRTVAESVGMVKKGTKAKTLPYRIHDYPDTTKLETLKNFVTKFGYKFKTTGSKNAISKSLNNLMDACAGRKEQKLIEIVALRAMMKAKYSVQNIGHYGLSFDYYTHFTSPIRRYPDTLVHRILTHYQNKGKSVDKEKYEEMCEHCSNMEIIAQLAERDSIKYKMVEFMADKIGKIYKAHISGIQSYGIYCEIDENHCEGLVPIRDLDDDYYDFDEKNYRLVGRRNHHIYQLGDPLLIKVAQANIEKRTLDFTIE